MESSFNFIGAYLTWSHIQKLKGFEGAIVYCTSLARTYMYYNGRWHRFEK